MIYRGYRQMKRRRRRDQDPLIKAILEGVRETLQLQEEQVSRQPDGFAWKAAFTHQEVTARRLGQSAMARAQVRVRLTQPVHPGGDLLADVQRANNAASAYACVWDPASRCVELRSSFHLHRELLPVMVERVAFAAAMQAVDGEAILRDLWPSLSRQETVAPWRKRPDLYGRLVALEQAPADLAAGCPERLDWLLQTDVDQAGAELLELGFSPRMHGMGLQLALPPSRGGGLSAAFLRVRVEEDERLGGVIVDELCLEPGLTLAEDELNALNLANLQTTFPCHGNGAWVQEDGMLVHESRLPGVFQRPGDVLRAAAGAAARVEVAANWLDRIGDEA